MPTRKREVKAVLTAEYPEAVAESVARALQADNSTTPETKIETARTGGVVISRVESISVEKLLPVLDDLLSCQSLCERTLEAADQQPDGEAD